MRSRRILALMLAAFMMISQVQPVYATAATPYKTEDGEAGIDTNIAQTDVENDTDIVQAGVENNTDGEENSTLTEDVDETDETEAEKQKKTEVEATEKTEDRKKSGNVKIDDVWEYYTTDLDYDLDEVAAYAADEETSEWQGSFGAQLDTLAKECYNSMKQAFISEGYEAEVPIARLKTVVTLKEPITFEASVVNGQFQQNEASTAAFNKLFQAVRQAYLALYSDYPEIYWPYAYSFGVTSDLNDIKTSDGENWTGYLYGVEFTVTKQYYDGCVTGEANDPTLLAYKAQVEKIVDEAKKDTDGSAYALAKYFHDYLCKELTYNYGSLTTGDLYPHTSVTAFVGYGDKKEKSVVCEGYAKAFKVLCDKVGIPCVLVSGQGVTSSDAGAHMWNYVQMEDKQWYLVDATWDDQDSSLYHTYFLAGNSTKGFNTTVGEEHIAEPISNNSDSGQDLGITFAYPVLAEDVYEYAPKTPLTDEKVSIICTEEYPWTGAAITPEFTVKYDSTDLEENTDYTVAYRNAAGEDIDEIQNAGTYELVFTGTGSYTGEIVKTIHVTRDLSSLDITTDSEQMYTGSAITPEITVREADTEKLLKAGTDYTVFYHNPSGTEVSEIKNVGYYKIIIAGIGDYTGSKELSVHVVRSVEDLNISLTESHDYTGSAIDPQLSVTEPETGAELQQNADYTVIYKDADGEKVTAIQEAGSYTVVITGTGDYTGEVTRTIYVIRPGDISQLTVSGLDPVTFTGKAVKTEFAIQNETYTLEEGTDYTVEYSSNLHAGTGRIKVTGIGSYSGERELTFQILPADMGEAYEAGNVNVDYASLYAWTGEAVNVEPYAVAVNGTFLLKGRDYRVEYTDASGTVTAYVKDAGSYTMILEGINDYTGTIELPVKVTKDMALSDVTVSVIPMQTYTGMEICPGVKLINPKTKAVLKEGTHYTVRYEENVNAGTALMTVDAVAGKGYTGRIQIPFMIVSRNISQVSIQGISSSYNYTGSPITPAPILKLGDVVLTEDVDYRLSYEANQTTGTAKLKITGLGNYTGTMATTFSISKTNMDLVDIDLDLTNVSAGGRPTVQVTWNGNVLKKKTDYMVTYTKSTDQRTGTVIVRGKGNYTGEVRRNYAIPRIMIHEEDISFAGTWYYTGRLIAAAPTKVIVNGKQLNRGVDYTIHYEDGEGNETMQVREPGNYKLVVEGQKNYQGTVKLSFKVTKDRLLGRMNVSSVKDQTYSGQPLTPEITVTDSGEDLISNLLGLKGTELKAETDYTIEYKNNTNVGTASIHLTAVEGSGYAGERTIQFQIVPMDINDVSVAVTLPQNGRINYDGMPCTPEPTVTMTTAAGDGQTGNVQTLSKGTDYTVAWYDNEKIGKAYMVIKGTGNYTGNRIVNFEIVKNTLTPSVTCKLDRDSYIYTGEAICPEITLTDVSTGKALTEGTDYRVSYEENINAGAASVIVYGITGSGYSGMYTQNFTIASRAINADDITVTLENSASDAAEPLQATVMDGKKILEEGTDYTISYEETEDEISAEIIGQGNYGGRRTEILQRIHLNDNALVDYTLEYYETLYTGSYLTPATFVTLDGELLQAGVDYSISYANNRMADTDGTPATVTIQGRGAYTGSMTRTFEIQQVDINRASVGSISTCTYWQVTNASVNLTYHGKHLQVNRDYTVSYDDEIRIGTNKVTLNGKGNYKGQIVLDLKVTYPTSDRLKLTGCTMTAYDEEAGTVTVQITAADNGKFANLMEATQIYMQVPGADGKNVWEKATIDTENKILTATFPADAHRRSNVMSKYVLAVPAENSTGYQQITSNSMYVDNPGEYAETTRSYFGFYQGKVDSKKGMQGVEDTDTKDLGVNAVLININLNELIKTSTNVRRFGSASYRPYTYKGKTYYFQDMVKYRKTIYELNRRVDTKDLEPDENDPTKLKDPTKYGNWTKNVTVDLLMKWDPELQYLIYPAGRVAGKNDYALNMSEASARATLEALFSYITESLGGTRGTDEGGWFEGDGSKSPQNFRVSNWVLGNEVNACKAWNYAGNVSTQECADNYARAFQVLYQAVKKSDRNARVFISLDHTWTAWTSDGHLGKEYLDRFAYYMHATEPQMEWHVDYHPYSNPLYRNDFWNDWSSTSGSEYTSYISMNNLWVLTNYLKKIENRYGIKNTDDDGNPDPTGGIRVILGEQGYIAANSSQEASQAAATAYEFYIASANTKVDAIMNRAYLDDSAEGIMTLGLRYNWSAKNHPAKQAYRVVKHMDDPDALTNATVNQYARYVRSGASKWTNILSGLKTETFYRP